MAKIDMAHKGTLFNENVLPTAWVENTMFPQTQAGRDLTDGEDAVESI